MLDIFGDMATHGAWAFLRNRSYPNRTAYYQAVGRLAKQGLLVKHHGLDTPQLRISQKGMESLEVYLRPEKRWNQKWNGIWYILVYDIPEVDRSYRNTLRQFLKQQRMGCFQKSVWITAHDIRPQYADLEEGAALGAFACLFEAKTVLGMSSEKVVWESWDFDTLYDIQKRFCEIYGENLEILQRAAVADLDSLMYLAGEEIDAYRSAFVLDPLLPNELLPRDYMGKEAYALHLKLAKAIRTKLMVLNPD
ncbi:PaaX family transcriptional regulator C-terminal domain-containing protein [Pontiellaceae bacterium B1224]|nr:PaaX family transcriptional regulator C-terminal domain-containing protein [Pontiellaceae bacterium B1224]